MKPFEQQGMDLFETVRGLVPRRHAISEGMTR